MIPLLFYRPLEALIKRKEVPHRASHPTTLPLT